MNCRKLIYGDSFDIQYKRIQNLLEMETQTDISNFLGIRQSSISEAKRRNSVPDNWKMLLLRKLGINPLYIENGAEPVYLEFKSTVKPNKKPSRIFMD